MDELTDIDKIICMLDEKTQSGVGRIKVEMDETMEESEVKERHHHGRCDVGSPFATGCIPNFED
ncbi:MAG: hypothetical protein K2G89_01180 [Lachnospiraceae bacterium]|nr:hypothetical protein [Lachnospiraceae bacterium]